MEESSEEICDNSVIEGEVSAISISEHSWEWKSKLCNSSGFLGGSVVVFGVVISFENLDISSDC
jgi:hypothetical protein